MLSTNSILPASCVTSIFDIAVTYKEIRPTSAAVTLNCASLALAASMRVRPWLKFPKVFKIEDVFATQAIADFRFPMTASRGSLGVSVSIRTC